MKKTLKIAAFVAAAMMGLGFVSCANDDAEDLGTLLIVKDYQEKKEAEAAAAAAAAKATENSSSNGSESSETAAAETYTLDLSKTKELGKIGPVSNNGDTVTKKLDDTVTFVIQETRSDSKAPSKSIQSYDDFIVMTANGLTYTSTNKYGIQLTLSKKADIAIKALTYNKTALTLNSGDDPITGQWGLIDINASDTSKTAYNSTGTPSEVTTVKAASGTAASDLGTPATLTFSDVAAGTYVLGGNKKGGYLFSLVITYKE